MPSEIDRDRTGGRNPPISGEEQDLVEIVRDVVRRQQRATERRLPDALADGKPFVEREKWERELATLSVPVLFAPFKRGGDRALGAFRRPAKARQREVSEILLAEWIDAPQVLAAIERESFLFADAVMDTLSEAVRAAMLEGMAAGEPIDKLKNRLIEVYEGWHEARHAEMIARTETARAFGGGQIEAWKQTGFVTHKVWDAASDACPFCLEMNGRKLDLDETWFDKGDNFTVDFQGTPISLSMDYAAIGFPPIHPNCRCAIIADMETLLGD